MTLQALYGTIPQIYGKGDSARVSIFYLIICTVLKQIMHRQRLSLLSASQHVANMMLRMKREFAGTQNQILPVFDTLLLLDRNVDLLTPLATQLTYEGLIDEVYGINNGQNTPFSVLLSLITAYSLVTVFPSRKRITFAVCFCFHMYFKY